MSLKRVREGWDVYLTQNFNLGTVLPPWVVDFPHEFGAFDSLASLLPQYACSQEEEPIAAVDRSAGSSPPSEPACSRIGAFLPNSLKDWSTSPEGIAAVARLKSMFGPEHVHFAGAARDALAMARVQMQVRYVLLWPPHARRGNAIGDALLAGAITLVVQGQKFINNELLRMSHADFSTPSALVDAIEELEKYRDKRRSLTRTQATFFNALNYDRPFVS
jgi:hypothetical protein